MTTIRLTTTIALGSLLLAITSPQLGCDDDDDDSAAAGPVCQGA